MPSRLKTIPKFTPTTAEEAENAILEFLSSDGCDEILHERSLAALRFLEQDRSNISVRTHKMRMALVSWRSDEITTKIRKS
jgi:hypothetical protein